MAHYPSFDFQRNLETAGEVIQAGPWRITPLLDTIGERRFLRYSRKPRGFPELRPSVVAFRGEAAAAMAPDACTTLHSTAVGPDGVEVLAEYVDVLSGSDVAAKDLRPLFDTLMRTLARYERFHFHISDLLPEAVGRAGDRFVLLPNAYIVPYLVGGGTSLVDVDVTAAGKVAPIPHTDFESDIIHTSLIGKFINRMSLGTCSFSERLREASEAIAAGDITSLSALHGQLFDVAIEQTQGVSLDDMFARADMDDLSEQVDEAIRAAAVDGSVVVVRGDSYTGKSSVLNKAAAALDRSDGYEVVQLDEWELFTRARRRVFSKAKTGTQTVWLIDDIDEKAFVLSDFSAAMLSEAEPHGSVIVSCRGEDSAEDLDNFLSVLKKKRGDKYVEVSTGHVGAEPEARRLASYLQSATKELGGTMKTTSSDTPATMIKKFLATLSEEERQILEFLAVTRFAMPLDLVLSVFPVAGERIRDSILRLTVIDSLELFYRRPAGKEPIGLYLRIDSTALRRLIYGSIGDSRRRNLHRTVANVAEQFGSFPVYFLIFHALESGDPLLAARHSVAYLKETKSDKRHPSIVALCAELAREQMFEGLPFADRLLALHEVAAGMFASSRGEEGERLLLAARDLVDDHDNDIKLKNAVRLSALFRLLADRWEGRGEFTRALELLEDVRDELQSALSIPEQAQLLNDIGWLQYRRGEYEKSMESCRLSLNTLNANQHPIIVAQALNLMGVVHFNTSRYDEAISYYEQSAYLRERAGADNAVAASFNNLALAYQAKGEYEKALEHYNKSLDLKRRQNNQVGIAGGYLNLALLYLEARNFKQAEEKCRESLAISEALENAQLAADNYITLGDIALENQDFESAEQHYERSREISHQQEAINEEMGALRRLSSLCLTQKRLKEAERYAEAAHKLVKRIGSRYEAAQIMVIFGDLELEQGRSAEALQHYEGAAATYIALSKYRLAVAVLSKLGLIHADSGNNFEARHHLDRAQELIRADIGRELPEEFISLQRMLRAKPSRGLSTGEESQKLLLAFYELSALTDFAADRHEFIRRSMDVVKEIADPLDCWLAIKTGPDRYTLFDNAGEPTAAAAKAHNKLFNRALVFGGPLDSTASDIADLVEEIDMPNHTGLVCVPLKAMGDELGCILFQVDTERLPLSKDDFFSWIGRQLSTSLKLMIHLNADLLSDAETTVSDELAGAQSRNKSRFENLIGKSEAMKKIFRTLGKVRDTDSGILILGESGTGKSALARATHFNSPRQNRQFQEIHCAQIPHNLLESELFGHERGSFTGAVTRKLGLCEMANGGTLFLDDINVMPVETQTKLLHFIENKSYMRLGGTQRLTADVRIIAASNEDLEELCRLGRFREDLYYRLKVILVDLPPLRERKDDMLAIALDYLKRSCADKGITPKTLAPETVQLLQKAPWRGNVRELQNVLERVVVLSDETLITPSSLPEDFLKEVTGTSVQSNQRLDELLDRIVKLGNYSEANPLLPLLEALLTRRMVDHVDGKSRAAAMLGISKPTLYARLRDYDKMH